MQWSISPNMKDEIGSQLDNKTVFYRVLLAGHATIINIGHISVLLMESGTRKNRQLEHRAADSREEQLSSPFYALSNF